MAICGMSKKKKIKRINSVVFSRWPQTRVSDSSKNVYSSLLPLYLTVTKSKPLADDFSTPVSSQFLDQDAILKVVLHFQAGSFNCFLLRENNIHGCYFPATKAIIWAHICPASWSKTQRCLFQVVYSHSNKAGTQWKSGHFLIQMTKQTGTKSTSLILRARLS